MVYLDAETERQRKCQDDEDPRHDDQGETATGALSRCIVYIHVHVYHIQTVTLVNGINTRKLSRPSPTVCKILAIS